MEANERKAIIEEGARDSLARVEVEKELQRSEKVLKLLLYDGVTK